MFFMSPADFIQREQYAELHPDKGLAHSMLWKKNEEPTPSWTLFHAETITCRPIQRFLKGNNCILEHMAMHYYY